MRSAMRAHDLASERVLARACDSAAFVPARVAADERLGPVWRAAVRFDREVDRMSAAERRRLLESWGASAEADGPFAEACARHAGRSRCWHSAAELLGWTFEGRGAPPALDADATLVLGGALVMGFAPSLQESGARFYREGSGLRLRALVGSVHGGRGARARLHRETLRQRAEKVLRALGRRLGLARTVDEHGGLEELLTLCAPGVLRAALQQDALCVRAPVRGATEGGLHAAGYAPPGSPFFR